MDDKLLLQLNRLLEQGCSIRTASRKLGFKNPNTLYHRIYRMGYRVKTRCYLVPISAKPIEELASSHETDR